MTKPLAIIEQVSTQSITEGSTVSYESFDFNSEDAYCEEMGEILNTIDVEITGMDLLLEDPGDISDFSHESSPSIEYQDLRFDTTVSTKKKPLGRRRRRINRESIDTDLSVDGDEVDSLVLTRNRLPNLIHTKKDVRRLTEFYKAGKGLMGEVDSFNLDCKRLPHIRNHRAREASRGDVARTHAGFDVLSRKHLHDDNIYTTESETSSHSFDSEIDSSDNVVQAARNQPPRRKAPEENNIEELEAESKNSLSSWTFSRRTPKRSQSGARAA